MRNLFNLFVLLSLFSSVVGVADEPNQWFSKQNKFDSAQQYHFEIAGSKAYLIVPEKALEGNPWIWRARFPGFHAEMDRELIKRGFHLAYFDVSNKFGCPEVIQRADKFYQFLVQKRGLNPKPAMEGVSRGGLFVYNWTAEHTDRVSCIYCDTPVCDFRSWPGGKGKGVGGGGAWKTCLAAYGLSEEDAMKYSQQPIDHAKVIADAKIPILHIVSDSDRVVPPPENTDLLRSNLQKHGHDMEIIRVPQGTEKSKGHHFTHPRPQQVVDFIWKHAR